MSIYDITVENILGFENTLKEYKGKFIIIVNTASKCGFTPQFEGLEKLYKEYKAKGLIIIGFPCNQFKNQDPGTNEEILSFCQSTYKITFPMYSKIDVNGDSRHELYKFLIMNTPRKKGKDIKWNFEKFLISREGKIINRYSSVVTPYKIGKNIKKII
ncbi:MAG: glutathione peroxidase [Clostridiales bacterium]|nr:glutathione peroxidase [Clostridiales bacterium]